MPSPLLRLEASLSTTSLLETGKQVFVVSFLIWAVNWGFPHFRSQISVSEWATLSHGDFLCVLVAVRFSVTKEKELADFAI